MKRRSSNLELLKIYSFMIVVHHFAFHQTFDFKTITIIIRAHYYALLESFE